MSPRAPAWCAPELLWGPGKETSLPQPCSSLPTAPAASGPGCGASEAGDYDRPERGHRGTSTLCPALPATPGPGLRGSVTMAPPRLLPSLGWRRLLPLLPSPTRGQVGGRRGANQAGLGAASRTQDAGGAAGGGSGGWRMSLCPDALWPGWRGVTTMPIQLFTRDCSSTVLWVQAGSPIKPRVGGVGGRNVMAPRTFLGLPRVRALPLHTQAPLLTDPGLPLAPHLPSSCPGTALRLCSLLSSPAPAPDPAPLAPRSPHPADPAPLRNAAHWPRWHQQCLRAAGALGGTGGPGPAPGQG